MKLFASDLDNTLIYSYKRIFGDAVCVEKKNEKELSYMTKNAFELLKKVNEKILFAPVTTRSLEQYERLNLFNNEKPKFALISNGGILLIDDKIDKNWYNESLSLIENCKSKLLTAIDILKKDKNVFFEPRLVDEMFVFAKTNDFENTRKNLLKYIDMENIIIDRNGEKIYVLPKSINKGSALKRLKELIKCSFIFAAGDSSFDIPMQEISDLYFFTNNKEMENCSKTIFFENNIFFGENILNYVLKEIC